MEAIKTVQIKINSIITERPIRHALASELRGAGEISCKLGDEVLVYFKIEKKWMDLFRVSSMRGNIDTVQQINSSKTLSSRLSGSNHSFETVHIVRNPFPPLLLHSKITFWLILESLNLKAPNIVRLLV